MKKVRSPIPLCLLAAGLLMAAAGSVQAESATSARAGGRDAGREFFHREVLPRLAENGCLTCHARGYLRPNVTHYEELLRRLAIGDSSENNVVIYKIANLRSIAPDRPNHPGGQRCEGIDAEPCRAIRAWWRIEFGGSEEPR
jgi:hypothetical protein